jgi:lipoate-protein ligase A
MRLLDTTLSHAAENLALDEAILVAAEEADGGEVLRFWEQPTYAVVLGAGGSASIDADITVCAADGVPILRRASGGGTVLLGPGCLCFSAVLAYDRAPGLDQIPLSNQYVLGRVANALRPLADRITLEGTSDLVIGEDLKFSGNAQQRKRRHFLHHGTLLCSFDLSLIPRYLNRPERQPAYRQDRTHLEFVANLGCSTAEAKSLLIREWQPQVDYGDIPWQVVRRLMAEKYESDEWNRRR